MDYVLQITIAAIAIIPTLLATIHSIKKDNQQNKNELKKSIEQISTRLDNHILEVEATKADERRLRILRFSDELRSGIKHSREHFDNVLEDIDRYEKYCKDNPDYPNTKCLLAIENIKSVYKRRLEKNDFLN